MKSKNKQVTVLRYEAWKFFHAKFNNATVADAEAIVNIISSVGLLRGMCMVYDAKQVGPYKTAEKFNQELENMTHSRFSVDYLLLQFFNINRKNNPTFDPIELADSLGYDPLVAKLFKKEK